MEREAAWDFRVPMLSGLNLESLHVASFWLVGIELFIAFSVAFGLACKKALVFLGCPRKSLFFHWFYKVVREKCCFFIGFTRLSSKSVVFSLVLQGLSAKNGVLHWFYKEN